MNQNSLLTIKLVRKLCFHSCKRFKRFWPSRLHFENYVKSTDRRLSTTITNFPFSKYRCDLDVQFAPITYSKLMLHFYSPWKRQKTSAWMKLNDMTFADIINTLFLTACSYHVTYAFQSESTLYSCLNVNKLLARNRREILSLSEYNWTRTHNHLVRKSWTLNTNSQPVVFWRFQGV